MKQPSCETSLSVSFQLKLQPRTPDSAVLQGRASFLPQRRGDRAGRSTRLLRRQLPPVPGHRTVGPAHRSCAHPQLPGHTCTHALHMQSTHLSFHHALHKTAADWTDSCFFDNEEIYHFFSSRKLSNLYYPFGYEHTVFTFYVVFISLFLSYVPILNGENGVMKNHLFSCLCNSSVCAQQLKPIATCVLPSQKPQQTQNALYHIYPLLF